MKGLNPLVSIIIIVMLVSTILISYFFAGLRIDTTKWRLTRVAMVHAHVMASEFMQEETGIVEPNRLRPLKSMGYVTNYYVVDAESGGKLLRGDNPLGSPGESSGIFDNKAYYSLPIVYESGGMNKYGILVVELTPQENWIQDENILTTYNEMKALWAEQGETKW